MKSIEITISKLRKKFDQIGISTGNDMIVKIHFDTTNNVQLLIGLLVNMHERVAIIPYTVSRANNKILSKSQSQVAKVSISHHKNPCATFYTSK